jgi:hypothetical protein
MSYVSVVCQYSIKYCTVLSITNMSYVSVVCQYSIKYHLSQPSFMSVISFIVSLHYMFRPQTGHHQVLSDNIMEKGPVN